MLHHLAWPRPVAAALALLIVSTAGATGAPPADDASAYYRVPFKDLELTEGTLPQVAPDPRGDDATTRLLVPLVRIDEPAGGEATCLPHAGRGWTAQAWRSQGEPGRVVLVRAPAGRDVSGRLWTPDEKFERLVELKFRIPHSAADDTGESRKAFHRARAAYYDELLGRGVPGAGYFRHQSRMAHLAAGHNPAQVNRNAAFVNAVRVHTDTVQDTYALFSGGRALAENLQLDRAMPVGTRPEQRTIPIERIRGVTVEEMPFRFWVKDMRPQIDPLAAYIPADQHGVFFPSFDAAARVVDEADETGLPVLNAMEPRAEHARSKERYQKQLCLSLAGLSRLLGPTLIDSVAVTGADPYLRTGADVAILFEAKDPAALRNLLSAQLAVWRQRVPDAAPVEGKVAGADYFGARSGDRAVCSYVATLDRVVVVTNSLKQLERIVETHRGSVGSLVNSPEYIFFRDRYPRGKDDESAFLILTDATIRRWCGPRWRIATARRTQAAAVLAELQAENLEKIASGKVPAKGIALTTERPLINPGQLLLTPRGVSSSTYGTLEYVTPVVELEGMETVTATEQQMYDRWRDGYQRNWSNYFDPIAARLSIKGGKTSVDLSVMPLIAQTKYKEMIALTQGVKLQPQSGDPHPEALLHFAMAMNRDSAPIKAISGYAVAAMGNKLKVEPLSWLGNSVALYFDDDPFWDEAAKAADPEEFMQENYTRLPVAVYAESNSPVRLAAFAVGLRTYVQGTAPNLTTWETRQHGDLVYVQISFHGTGMNEIDRTKLYYAVTPNALVLSINEGVIQRHLDRAAGRKAKPEAQGADANAQAKAQPGVVKIQPWSGQSMAVTADARALRMLQGLYGKEYRRRSQQLAWNNLPVLNEWKRLYPAEDPVQVHQRLWHHRLIDPAGGRYVWNEKFQTMESTTYGHPGAPKDGPAAPPQLDRLVRAAMGVTFEEHGLRARATIERR